MHVQVTNVDFFEIESNGAYCADTAVVRLLKISGNQRPGQACDQQVNCEENRKCTIYNIEKILMHSFILLVFIIIHRPTDIITLRGMC